MAEPNDQLRRARGRIESPYATGEPLSRQELAELVNAWVFEHHDTMIELDANYVGKLEQGSIRWPQDPHRREAFRAVLGVETDAELGFRRPRRSRPTVLGVERQQFIRVGLGAGAAAAAGSSAVAELITPTQPRRIPSVVGLSDVAEVRAAAQAFVDWDRLYGGGVLREAVTAQLRYCAELLDARCPERVRSELLAAVADLAEVAGFMAFDAYAHDDARNLFRFALSCAEEAGDWQLRARVLSSQASQAIWCGDPDTGLTYIELALVRTDRLTATHRALLHTTRARALGKLNRAQDTATAVGAADEEFDHSQPADDPAWMAFYDVAQHSHGTGHALWEIAVHGQCVTEARHRLAAAVAGHGEARARGRARSQTRLASLVMATGDPAEAAILGGQVLDMVGTIRSRRVADDLCDLRRLGRPHERLTEVAELRQRIGAVVATA